MKKNVGLFILPLLLALSLTACDIDEAINSETPTAAPTEDTATDVTQPEETKSEGTTAGNTTEIVSNAESSTSTDIFGGFGLFCAAMGIVSLFVKCCKYKKQSGLKENNNLVAQQSASFKKGR